MNNTPSPLERNILLLLLALFFSFGLFDHSLWGPNDCREGAMIWDMVQAGHWVTPTLNGVPYLEKPPLLHWTGVILCRLFGTVNEGLVRLPAALYGFGTVLLLWLWGRRLGRERAGLAAAFLCATSFTFLEYSKIVLTDTCLAFMVLLSLTLFWNALTAPRPRAGLYLLFVLVSALSFYAKGLLGPGFVWVSVGTYLLYRRNWKLAFGLPLVFLPVFVLVLAPWAWALWREGGVDFLRSVFWDNQFGRFLTFSNPDLPPDPYFVHKEPIYFYLMSIPASLLPWLLLVLPAMVRWFRRGQGLGDPLAVFMRFCVISMLLVLHASSAKVGVYALSIFPILFLMTAIWLEDATTRWASKTDRWPLLATVHLLSAILWLAPPVYVSLFFLPASLRQQYLGGLDLLRDLGTAKAALTAALAGIAWVLSIGTYRKLRARFRQGDRPLVALWMPAAWATLLMLTAFVVLPIYDDQRGHKPVAALLSAEITQGRQISLGFTEEKYVGAFTFYTRQRLPVTPLSPDLRVAMKNSPVPVGLLVKTKDLRQHGADWGFDAFPALKPDHHGYATDKFRLLIHDPS